MTLADVALPFGEIALSDDDFNAIAAMVRTHSGIVLSASKRDLVYSRLRRRLRQIDVASFSAYRALLADDSAELVRMINAITTNLTGFFREPHHFSYLEEELLPALAAERRRIRIWSAGCSSGEEPYTIAMSLRRSLPGIDGMDVRVLATDIDTDMVASGAAGRYPLSKAQPIPADLRRGYVRQVDEATVEMDDRLKALISFRSLNLLGEWPMSGPFDAIFCRNVVIYFDKPTQRTLFDRFADLLTPGGMLFIGHSESLFRVSERFQHLGRTIHRKIR